MVSVEQLRAIPFFEYFSAKELAFLSEFNSFFQYFDDGDQIIRQGSDNSSLCILLKGQGHVTRDDHPGQTIATIQPGEVFGEMSFLTGRPRHANVIAVGEVTLFRMDGELFELMPAEMRLKVQTRLNLVLVKRLDDMNATMLKLMR